MNPLLADKIQRAFEAGANYKIEIAADLLKQAQGTASNNPCAQALIGFGLGQLSASQEISVALVHFQQAEKLFQQVGTPLDLAIVHERIAQMQHLSGNNDGFMSAAPDIAKALRDAGDPANAIKVQTLMLMYGGNGQKPDEVAALLHALETVSTANTVAVRGYVEWALGSSMRRTGRYDEILAHFRASLKDLSECDCEPQTKAAVLLTMAIAADSSGNAETVLEYASQADEIYRKDHFDSLRPQAMRLIAAAYARKHEWTRAIMQYESAIRSAEERHVASAIPDLSLELAAAYGDSGQPTKGMEELGHTASLKLNPIQHCSLIEQRSILEHQARLLPQSAEDGSEALSSCKELLQPADYASLSMNMADVELLMGHTEDGVQRARESIAIIDTQRPRVRSSDAALVQFNDNQNQAYTVLIRALLQAGKPEEALLASEQDRARAFVDLSNTESRTAAAPALAAAREPGARTDLRSEVHPFTLTIADIHKVIDAQHSTLLSYWVGDDRLYTWIMAPGKPVVEKDVALTRTQLASLVRATLPGESPALARGARAQPQVRTRGGESQTIAQPSRKPWRDLYQTLIAPIASELPATDGALLTIIPQGPLFQLSFAALLDASNHYLIERYAINVAPSVGTLQITARNGAAAAALPAHYVVVANPEQLPSVNGIPLPALPGTEAEAHGIERQLKAQHFTLLEGREAGIDTLMRSVPGTTVLHFATHAIVSDNVPSSSFLALDARQRDGRLTTASVYGMHLQTSLVVLSACRTGRGQISGDGVAGLSRAFFYAGAASLVTTLWDVVDEPTAQLMPAFYGELMSGKSSSAALREAQLQLIHRLRSHQVLVPTLAGGSVRLPEARPLIGQPFRSLGSLNRLRFRTKPCSGILIQTALFPFFFACDEPYG